MSPQWEQAACRLGQNLHSTGVFPCSSTILTMTLAAGGASSLNSRCSTRIPSVVTHLYPTVCRTASRASNETLKRVSSPHGTSLAGGRGPTLNLLLPGRRRKTHNMGMRMSQVCRPRGSLRLGQTLTDHADFFCGPSAQTYFHFGGSGMHGHARRGACDARVPPSAIAILQYPKKYSSTHTKRQFSEIHHKPG